MIFVKFILILLLGFIAISLFSGLFFLVKDKGQTRRTVNALSFRIGLSIVAILVVIGAAATGVIDFNANPLNSRATAPTEAPDNSPPSSPDDNVGGGRRPITPDD